VPTVRALAAVGAGVESLSKRKRLKATKKAKKRAAHPPSAARLVGQHGLTEPASRQEKSLGARLETQRAKELCQTTCRHYDTIAGKGA